MEDNWNKLIERYLNNELSAEGKEAFESELAKNSSLQYELELHQLTQDLVRRTAIRRVVVKRGKFIQLKKNLTTAGIIAVVATAIITALVVLGSSKPSSPKSTEERLDKAMIERMETELGLDNTDVQYFKFTGEDDVFLSESGVLLSITDNSFLLNGNPYEGDAVVQWQEAQTAAEIVKAGLSTTSGDKLLETQGMFSLNAFTPEGKQLELSNTGIYVQVPVAEHKEGMMLFNGVKGNDGKIDWQDPQRMEKLPVPKSMADIDLFPPNYEPKLNELKWFAEKSKRDSLYLSFDEEIETALKSTSGSKEEKFYSVPISNQNVNSRDQAPPDSVGFRFGAAYLTTLAGTPQDKVKWTFSLEKIKGTNEAWVIANVNIEKDWCINSIYRPANSFGPPTLFSLDESEDYEVISGPVEPEPVIQYDQQLEENLAYHVGKITFKLKIRIKNQQSRGKITICYGYQTGEVGKFVLPQYDATFQLALNGDTPIKSHIPPSKVLAIWSTKFDNTILATQDFEKRMKAIHNTCDERVFDIYANNLNEALWKLDQRVVELGYPEFQKFADERVGKLNLKNEHQQNLKLFYEQATKTIRENGKNAALAALKKEQKWNSDLNKARTDEVYRKGLRDATNRQEESAFNLQNVCKQMGIVKSFTISGTTFPRGNNTKNNMQGKDFSKKYAQRKSVAAKEQSQSANYSAFTGPFILNIDSQVALATTARKTSTVKDYHSKKQAEISYSPLIVSVDSYKQYDKLFFYLFSKETASYQRLDFSNGKLDYSLNDDMNYTAAVVGMNEDGYFLLEIETLKSQDLGTIKLSEVSETEFDKRINEMNSGRTVRTMEIQSELNWLFKEKANYRVQKQRRENVAFRAVVRPTIYVCELSEGEEIIEPTDNGTIVSNPEKTATLGGGPGFLIAYINSNIVYPQSALEKGISGKVYLKFVVSEIGKISNVTVTKGIPSCPECDAEAKRVIENTPDWIPAKNNGNNVASWYYLPISFRVN